MLRPHKLIHADCWLHAFPFFFSFFPTLYTNQQYKPSRVCLGFGCSRIQGLEDYIFNFTELGTPTRTEQDGESPLDALLPLQTEFCS